MPREKRKCAAHAILGMYDRCVSLHRCMHHEATPSAHHGRACAQPVSICGQPQTVRNRCMRGERSQNCASSALKSIRSSALRARRACVCGCSAHVDRTRDVCVLLEPPRCYAPEPRHAQPHLRPPAESDAQSALLGRERQGRRCLTRGGALCRERSGAVRQRGGDVGRSVHPRRRRLDNERWGAKSASGLRGMSGLAEARACTTLHMARTNAGKTTEREEATAMSREASKKDAGARLTSRLLGWTDKPSPHWMYRPHSSRPCVGSCRRLRENLPIADGSELILPVKLCLHSGE
eukprot:1787994-Pleurochrysis_carterae.AAC.2